MRLKKVETTSMLERRVRTRSKEYIALLDEFIASGEKYMEVLDMPEDRTAYKNRNNLAAAAKHYKYAVAVHCFGDHVFLERLI